MTYLVKFVKLIFSHYYWPVVVLQKKTLTSLRSALLFSPLKESCYIYYYCWSFYRPSSLQFQRVYLYSNTDWHRLASMLNPTFSCHFQVLAKTLLPLHSVLQNCFWERSSHSVKSAISCLLLACRCENMEVNLC